MQIRAAELAAAVGGHLVGDDVVVDGATNDSRAVVPGQLFVPVVAERDGHDFIGSALEAGAAAYLTARGAVGGTAIEVDDTSRALAAAGRLARDRLPDRVVGVTGSVGKTSVKDLLSAALRVRWATAASHRSFNNELGVPITLLGAPDGTDAVVVEMGARDVGHVADLCAIARPTVGLVTRVAGAHLEIFGTIEDVARAKGELVEALPSSGTAVLNSDDERVAAMATRTSARVLTYGSAGEVRAERLDLDDVLRASFVLATPWGSTPVHLAVRGRHQAENALAAAAAALAVDVPLDGVAAGLATASLSPGRMDLKVARAGGHVLDDAYNANPASVAAALRSLVEIPGRRHLAVLGPMAELGPTSASEHRAIATLADALGVELIAVGTEAYGVERVAADPAEALDLLGPVDEGTVVLVKGSRVAQLERVVDDLI